MNLPKLPIEKLNVRARRSSAMVERLTYDLKYKGTNPDNAG